MTPEYTECLVRLKQAFIDLTATDEHINLMRDYSDPLHVILVTNNIGLAILELERNIRIMEGSK